MATDLIAAATIQLKYAKNEIDSGDVTKGLTHIGKAQAFLYRAGQDSGKPVAEVTITVQEWTGTWQAAYDRFIEGADELLIAQGKPAGHDGAERGSLTRKECVDLATELGVLDELGGADFFGPDSEGVEE